MMRRLRPRRGAAPPPPPRPPTRRDTSSAMFWRTACAISAAALATMLFSVRSRADSRGGRPGFLGMLVLYKSASEIATEKCTILASIVWRPLIDPLPNQIDVTVGQRRQATGRIGHALTVADAEVAQQLADQIALSTIGGFDTLKLGMLRGIDANQSRVCGCSRVQIHALRKRNRVVAIERCAACLQERLNLGPKLARGRGRCGRCDHLLHPVGVHVAGPVDRAHHHEVGAAG